ncbi:hypothetical protein NLG97_g3316 [Lecanicillium saksenae]|uniref:Uncharacterized protein n=1 Tax=Lecanicillium saksenae TaxID=468837 RepID=A0ACC1R152_9HYPO|nr:hypothetical protein NLG97_g3316 [Lecanicillium saksenae]
MAYNCESVARAVQKARSFFSDGIISDFLDLPTTMDVETLANFLAQEIDYNYCIRLWQVESDDYPDDYFQLAKVMRDIFSARFCQHFRTRCIEFDEMVDGKPLPRRLWVFRPSLKAKLAISSAVISDKTYAEWIEKFCAEIARFCLPDDETQSDSETESSKEAGYVSL